MLLAANAVRRAGRGHFLESQRTAAARPNIAFVLVILWCLCMAGFAVSTVYVLSFVLLFIAGFLNLAFVSMAQTLVQLHAPAHIRGRVIGLFGTSLNGMRAFSGVTVGMLREPDRRSLVAGAERGRRCWRSRIGLLAFAMRTRAGRTGASDPFLAAAKSGTLGHLQSAIRRRRPTGRTYMFSKINHVAIVSENYAQLAQFYQACFGMKTSRQDPAGPGGDGARRLCRASTSIRAAPAARPASIISASRSRTPRPSIDRMRKKYPTREVAQAAVDPAVRRHHHPRSGRQHVRHLAEGHGEPHLGLCRERRQGQSAPHQPRGVAHACIPTTWRSSIATCSSSRRRT